MVLSVNYLLIILLSICVANACHVSCKKCDNATNGCIGCLDSNSYMDRFQKSCICNLGYYTSSLSPFKCQLLSNYDAKGNMIALQVESCKLEMGLKTNLIKVSQVTSIVKKKDVQYVQAVISLGIDAVSISQDCQKQYITELQYQDPITKDYIDLNPIYFKSGDLGQQTILISLGDFSKLSISSTKTADQIINKINFGIKIGSKDLFFRYHKFNIYLYTNMLVVNVMTLDTFQQIANLNCIKSQQCITINNLDTNVKVCADKTCAKPLDNLVFQVGDKFYAQIYFANPTKNKQLQFNTLYFKDDNNKIYDFSTYAVATWDATNSKLDVSFTVAFPSLHGVVQISTTIVNATTKLRGLQSEEGQGEGVEEGEEKIEIQHKLFLQVSDQGLTQDHGNQAVDQNKNSSQQTNEMFSSVNIFFELMLVLLLALFY